MATTKMIAGLMGPTLLAIGIAMLVNARHFPEMAKQIGNDPGLIFVSGILLLVAGLAIVRVHNVWSGGWRVVVTVLGWLAVISGILRMLLPFWAASIASSLGQSSTPVSSARSCPCSSAPFFPTKRSPSIELYFANALSQAKSQGLIRSSNRCQTPSKKILLPPPASAIRDRLRRRRFR
ncbi:MAG: hypothetical protein WBL98_07235 [Pseudolabrys sp.]